MKKQVLFTILAMLVSVSAFSHDIEVANADGVTIYYNYITDGTELEVTFRGSSYDYSKEYHGNVVIPASVTYSGKTYPVTSIRNYAFRECSGLTSVTIPNSVTSIGNYAFERCSGLTSIEIPNSVTSIGSSAFEYCSGLKKVIVKDIAAWCGIKFSDVYSNPLSNAKHLYSDEETEIANLIIPNSVTSIGSSAFSGCSGLTSVTIPNSVTSIGSSAFYGCSGLTSIIIPNSVTSIGNSAFSECKSLTSVTIPNSMTSIGSAFSSCDRISMLYILASQPPYVGNKACFTDDVYRYAYIHIPKGTYEAYSSAYGWRYFERFKEDLAMDGTTYYAKLRVNEQNNSYVEHEVKVEESYTLKFGTKRQSAIKKLLFNGDDVTEQIKNNTYTTPIIKSDSEITIEYDEQERDVNGDGVVDTQDVLEIYKYIQEH